jgi:hypothetical protein
MNLFKSTLLIAAALNALSGCGRAQNGIVAPGAAPNDIAALSDEFDNAASATQWKSVAQVEGWNANQLEIFDVNKIYPGQCALMPFTSTWYKDYRGTLLFKAVKGDFVMSTKLKVTGRDGQNPPRSQFSLGGLMIRAPRDITPQTWRPGGENYNFLSLGAASRPGTYQLEFKTTINSDSQLQIRDVNVSDAELQIARIGTAVILLAKLPNEDWRVINRYNRADYPQELQAGMCCYTDYPSASRHPAQQHNGMVLHEGNPDLGVLYDYIRYARPRVPQQLQGRNLANPNDASDADLLRFLGDAARGNGGNGAAP